MLSLFCFHEYTPPRRHTPADRARLGIPASAALPACYFAKSCASCGKLRDVFEHDYGPPFEKDYWLEDGEKMHHTVRKCIHCGDMTAV